MNAELKPCPFCGGQDIECIWDDGYEVGCKQCSTYVAPFLGAEADNKSLVIEFWNTRDTSDLRAAQIRALEWVQKHNGGGFYGDIENKLNELKAGGELL